MKQGNCAVLAIEVTVYRKVRARASDRLFIETIWQQRVKVLCGNHCRHHHAAVVPAVRIFRLMVPRTGRHIEQRSLRHVIIRAEVEHTALEPLRVAARMVTSRKTVVSRKPRWKSITALPADPVSAKRSSTAVLLIPMATPRQREPARPAKRQRRLKVKSAAS